MALTATWNAAAPADSDAVGLGADEIRDLKRDIEERMQIDHVWDSSSATGIDQDGLHQTVTLPNDGGSPGTLANRASLYAIDVAGSTEVFAKNETGTAVQLTSVSSMGLAGQALLGTLTGDVIGDVTGHATILWDTTAGSELFLRYTDATIATATTVKHETVPADYVASIGPGYISGDTTVSFVVFAKTPGGTLSFYSMSNPLNLQAVSTDTVVRFYYLASS